MIARELLSGASASRGLIRHRLRHRHRPSGRATDPAVGPAWAFGGLRTRSRHRPRHVHGDVAQRPALLVAHWHASEPGGSQLFAETDDRRRAGGRPDADQLAVDLDRRQRAYTDLKLDHEGAADDATTDSARRPICRPGAIAGCEADGAALDPVLSAVSRSAFAPAAPAARRVRLWMPWLSDLAIGAAHRLGDLASLPFADEPLRRELSPSD